MNIGELDGVKIILSPEAYAKVKKQKIIEENKILKEQQQELERYKNIIDELEKELKLNLKFRVIGVRRLLNKLKELKGE